MFAVFCWREVTILFVRPGARREWCWRRVSKPQMGWQSAAVLARLFHYIDAHARQIAAGGTGQRSRGPAGCSCCWRRRRCIRSRVRVWIRRNVAQTARTARRRANAGLRATQRPHPYDHRRARLRAARVHATPSARCSQLLQPAAVMPRCPKAHGWLFPTCPQRERAMSPRRSSAVRPRSPRRSRTTRRCQRERNALNPDREVIPVTRPQLIQRLLERVFATGRPRAVQTVRHDSGVAYPLQVPRRSGAEGDHDPFDRQGHGGGRSAPRSTARARRRSSSTGSGT